MKVQISIVVVVIALLLGMSSIGHCADIETIDNIGVARIVSMEVRPTYVITDQTFAWLQAEEVPEEILANQNLQILKDFEYSGREEFVRILEQTLGKKILAQAIEESTLQTLLLRYAKQRPSAKAPYHLEILVDIINKNDRDLKLTDAIFEFFLHDEEAKDEVIPIGSDTVYQTQDMYLESNPTNAPEKIARVKFLVQFGNEQPAGLDRLAHLLNFIGNPSSEDYLFIQGKFDLGIKSTKGWTYAEAIKVEWQFCPDMQNQLPLDECFVELPPPPPRSLTPTPTPTPLQIGYDEHGNPKSRVHELGWGDNERLKDERILLYTGYNGQDDHEAFQWYHARNSVAERNIQMDIVAPSVRGRCSLTKEMLSGYTQLWFVSDRRQSLTNDHLALIEEFVKKGNGLLIWADNEPFYADANLLAERLIGTKFSGNKKGDKILRPGDSLKPGFFVEHPLTQGVNKLYEGITISTISPVTYLTILAQSHDGQMCMACFEKENQRIVLDTGFTKLIGDNFYNTAGTARYFRNIAFWLSRPSRGYEYYLLTTGRDGIATISAAEESEHYQFEITKPTTLAFDLYWMGEAMLEFIVKNPNAEIVHEQVYGHYKNRIQVEANIPGEWECWVRGVNVSVPDLQYVLNLRIGVSDN